MGFFLRRFRRDFAFDTFNLGSDRHYRQPSSTCYPMFCGVRDCHLLHKSSHMSRSSAGAVTIARSAARRDRGRTHHGVGRNFVGGAGAPPGHLHAGWQFEQSNNCSCPPWKSRAMGAVQCKADPPRANPRRDSPLFGFNHGSNAWLAMQRLSFRRHRLNHGCCPTVLLPR